MVTMESVQETTVALSNDTIADDAIRKGRPTSSTLTIYIFLQKLGPKCTPGPTSLTRAASWRT